MPRSPSPRRQREYRDLDNPRSRSRSYSPRRNHKRYREDSRERRRYRDDSRDRYDSRRYRRASPSRRGSN